MEQIHAERARNLIDAIKTNDLKRVKALLAANVDPNGQAPPCETPLYIATDPDIRNIKIVEALLAAGANPDATITGQVNAAPLLVSVAKMRRYHKRGNVQPAMTEWFADVALALLRHNADPTARHGDSTAPDISDLVEQVKREREEQVKREREVKALRDTYNTYNQEVNSGGARSLPHLTLPTPRRADLADLPAHLMEMIYAHARNGIGPPPTDYSGAPSTGGGAASGGTEAAFAHVLL